MAGKASGAQGQRPEFRTTRNHILESQAQQHIHGCRSAEADWGLLTSSLADSDKLQETVQERGRAMCSSVEEREGNCWSLVGKERL